MTGRVVKGTISVWSCDPTVSGLQPNRDTILGPAGEQLAGGPGPSLLGTGMDVR